MSGSALASFLESSVRTATPLALAALGETMAERSGVINVGIEGAIISGALGAAVVATHWGAPAGLVGGIAAGLLTAAVFSLFVLFLRADQIISGTAVTIGALGLTSALYRVLFGSAGAALSIPTLPGIAVAGLSRIPVVGLAFFGQPITTLLAYACAIGAHLFLYRTSRGLAWRAVGESPEAAHAAGISPRRVRLAAVAASGALGGLSGATLVLAQTGTFAEGMSAGRGFIAITIVALGRWSPLGSLIASLVFGAAAAMQFVFQSLGSTLPYQLFLALPYVVALGVLATGVGRTRAPAALGKPLPGDIAA